MTAARISQSELQPLPRWARLALAARCLRRAHGLVRPPGAEVIDTALLRLEDAVSHGRAGEELEESAARAYTLALDNLDAPAPASASLADLDVITCMVAHATAFAAEAATLDDARQAAHLVAQCIDFAIHAFRLAGTAADAEPITAIRADLLHLQAVAGAWNDETPVPGKIFPTS